MSDARVKSVSVGDDRLTVELIDGRAISVPLAWYPRLLAASSEQRNHWEIAGGGAGVHWPEIDEDVSVAAMLRTDRTSARHPRAGWAEAARAIAAAEDNAL